MRIVGLDHIVLRCRDVEASLAWYCGELGLEALDAEEWRAGRRPFPSVRVDAGTIIDLFAVDAEEPGPPGRGNLDHFALVVEGAAPEALVARFPDGRRADGLAGAKGSGTGVYVRDPDGNTVELRVYGGAAVRP
jgi:catechol 2,3-dioxygenase-like lactoylglutathione lyase family enzyme